MTLHPRLDAVRELKRAIGGLDDEELLDQFAFDRVLAATLGVFRLEANAVLEARRRAKRGAR